MGFQESHGWQCQWCWQYCHSWRQYTHQNYKLLHWVRGQSKLLILDQSCASRLHMCDVPELQPWVLCSEKSAWKEVEPCLEWLRHESMDAVWGCTSVFGNVDKEYICSFFTIRNLFGFDISFITFSVSGCRGIDLGLPPSNVWAVILINYNRMV
jgi:hypothetical protein